MVWSPQSLVFVGLALSVTSTTFSNFGQNIQKYAFIKYSQITGSTGQPNQYRLWRWWIGLGFVIFGALFDFAALKFAPQSVIMPAGAISLGINPLFASLWLGEKFTMADIRGTLLIVAGAVGVACTYAVLGTVEDHEYTLKQLLALYTRPVMFLYALFILGMIRYLSRLMKRCEKLRAIAIKQDNDDDLGSRMELGATETGGLPLPGSGASDAYAEVQQWHPITYGALSGIFGAQSVLFAKSTVELVSTSITTANQFNDPFAFGVVVCMLLSIAGQTHFLAEGLKHFDALIIVPVFQCFIITFSILGGATYFEELYGFSMEQWALFTVSVSTALYGVIVLAKARPVPSVGVKPVGCAEEYGDNKRMVEMIGVASPASPPQTTNHALGTLDSAMTDLSTLEEASDSSAAGDAIALDQLKDETAEDSVGSFLFGANDPVVMNAPLWSNGVVQRQCSSGSLSGGVVQRSSSSGSLSPNQHARHHGGIIHL